MANDTSWRVLAVDDLKNTTMSIAAIGKKYSRSHSTIMKLMKDRGIIRSKGNARRGPKSLSNGEALSDRHRILGIRLSLFTASTSYQYASERFGLSVQRIQKMQLGQHDFTLTELDKIRGVLELSLEDLFTSYDQSKSAG
jgi:hypothetical protein